ncbi:MAG: endonuclease/exonuclease/phosphatase family protein, partial [Pseudomonadota bacterium]
MRIQNGAPSWARRGLHVLLAILIVATILPLIAADAWWVRVLEFPRVQIVVIMVAVMAALVFFGGRTSRFWLLAGTVAAIYQVIRIFPYTPLYPVQAVTVDTCPANQSMQILVVNVLQDNRDFARTVALVEDEAPDVFLALETDRPWVEALTAIHDAYPNRRLVPLDNTYGLAFYSRLPVHALDERYVVEPDVPSIRATIGLPSGAAFDLYGLHPPPPQPRKKKSTPAPQQVLNGTEHR